MVSPTPTIMVTSTKKTTSDVMKCPPYRIDFSKSALGRVIANSKRQLRWKFGYANPSALTDGKIGFDCCNESDEHEVIVTYSLTSGKRQIIMDQHEVYYTEGRSIQEGKFEYSWTTRTGHIMKIAAYFTVQCHVRKYDLFIDGMSFFTFPQIHELGTEKAIQRITVQLALQALNENGTEPQKQQQRPHGVVEPIYDDTDYTYRKKNKVLLTEASPRRKMQGQDDSNSDHASKPTETSQEIVPYNAAAVAAPMVDLLFDTPTSTTCTDLDLFDSPTNNNSYADYYQNAAAASTPMGGTAYNGMVTYQSGGVAANAFGNPFYGNDASASSYSIQNNNQYNNNNQWNNTAYGSNESYVNRCTDYNQINSVYGNGDNYLQCQQQQSPSPPSLETLTPSSFMPSSPTSSMTTSFLSSTEKPMALSQEITSLDSNTKEVNDADSVLRMLVNLDDLLQEPSTTNINRKQSDPTKSMPIPSLSGQFGNGATLNDVKAAISASQGTNEVAQSYYHHQSMVPQPQLPYGSMTPPQSPQTHYNNGYQTTTLSPQNMYGSHSAQQQPYHPQYYYQPQASY